MRNTRRPRGSLTAGLMVTGALLFGAALAIGGVPIWLGPAVIVVGLVVYAVTEPAPGSADERPANPYPQDSW